MKHHRPLSRALLTALAVLILAVAAPAAGAAEPSGPQQVIREVSDALTRVLREDRELLRTDPAYVHRLVDELFLPHVDFDRVSALVLGPHWRRATPEQRLRFREAFKGMLIHTYATAVNELSEWEIRFLPLRESEGARDLVVRTQVLRPGGEPIGVDYRMVERDGRWLAYDVSVEGVSLLSAYRSSFVQMAREKGIDGLIAELESRNATRPSAS
jgi:phospholipid transport system substrate-binding protein